MAQPEIYTEQQIHQAIINNEMFLEYMPTVSLMQDLRCVGAEALVRWKHQGQIIEPMDFVPLVENTPVAGALTYWVIDQVAKELGPWLKQYPGAQIGINVPPKVLGRGGFEYVARTSKLLDYPGSILLEVTERGIPDRLGLEELKEVSDEGVAIGLDDIAARSRNLLVLFQAPVDVIKLDREVSRSIDDSGHSSLLQELAPLIQASGRKVVAECVERIEQEAALRKAGIEMAQGWLYSKSLPAEEFIAWHAAHQHSTQQEQV
ncbi:EAL domain-containing protein [Pseudoxanthomonas sp. 3HH-4]|uniref:EAL domain-containing protein n=1 Tax=Pseudoxanthomonas sp. 3HH-4 TaxID=1690214 RepID=UPI001151E801|nr:EAL domain-containing protein [Pseudoxanthomonas sp. 3HH-4]TQM12305.1 EAL domain-containing protein [Pseudoxanthomonas sp. 3HH-4]